ncbi:MAG: group II truncated hemoglobin [Steroidobacteraceae bacterium]|nr:group II truncated hemoglobin [Nevskiaceae bacterium]MCP5339338.1 group II truncated hemoglobin [Nevskiaceae bacterium]MCP5471381.1 group II truncated hemoglobin [Nevskiaceae bacterium]
MSAATSDLATTPYELLGGNEEIVRRIVDRFYDLMDAAPEARELREMHAPDLGPMRDRLSWFLTGWLGGPAVYAERTGGGACMSTVHGVFAIDERASAQWMWCMRRALDAPDVPASVRSMVEPALERMTGLLRNR